MTFWRLLAWPFDTLDFLASTTKPIRNKLGVLVVSFKSRWQSCPKDKWTCRLSTTGSVLFPISDAINISFVLKRKTQTDGEKNGRHLYSDRVGYVDPALRYRLIPFYFFFERTIFTVNFSWCTNLTGMTNRCRRRRHRRRTVTFRK